MTSKAREVRLLEARQVRIFPADQDPFTRITGPKLVKALAEHLGDAVFDTSSEHELTFAGGVVSLDGGKTSHAIKALAIAERKVTLAVDGGTAVAVAAYRLLEDFVQSTGRPLVEPLILTHETVCVARLEFDWLALLSEPFVRFAQEAVSNVLSEHSRARLIGANIGLHLRFGEVSDPLRAQGITLADKRLTIEPRMNTLPEERLYFTGSPTDSATHLKLLDTLEAAIASSQR